MTGQSATEVGADPEVALSHSTALLSVLGVHKSFGGVKAVDGVTLELAEGGVTAIIGPNGAGKSTLFNLITARIHPDAGRVLFHGRDITGLSTARIARLGLGRAFQDVRLFADLSVIHNVAVYSQSPSSASLWRTVLLAPTQFAADRAAIQASREALARLGIEHLASQRAGGLSFADQKLVSLARLIALGSTLLLLDEPASGLDASGREMVMGSVEQLARTGYTVVLVEHNLDVVRRLARHVVFMVQGRIVAQGHPEEIFASADLAEIYFGVGRHSAKES
jgi:ABC-type branched-subunit amino acid transport system ATPase component